MDLYDALCAWTLELRDPEFIHQHVVDAHMAQHADEHAKPIGITMALVGLYLHAERGYTGREVQLVHMKLARRKQPWPKFELPADRGSMTEADVMAAADRKGAIHEWAKSVWCAFQSNRNTVFELLQRNGI